MRITAGSSRSKMCVYMCAHVCVMKKTTLDLQGQMVRRRHVPALVLKQSASNMEPHGTVPYGSTMCRRNELDQIALVIGSNDTARNGSEASSPGGWPIFCGFFLGDKARFMRYSLLSRRVFSQRPPLRTFSMMKSDRLLFLPMSANVFCPTSG